jgi:hypothetical protein
MKNHHRHHLHGHKGQINQLLSIIIYANIQTQQNIFYRGNGKEREREREFAELLQVDAMVVMAEWRGLSGGDGRADGVVPKRGGDGDGSGGGRGGGGVVLGVVV